MYYSWAGDMDASILAPRCAMCTQYTRNTGNQSTREDQSTQAAQPQPTTTAAQPQPTTTTTQPQRMTTGTHSTHE